MPLESSEQRNARIRRIKRQVQAGKYSVDPEKIAEAILQSADWKNPNQIPHVEVHPHPDGSALIFISHGCWFIQRSAGGHLAELDSKERKKLADYVQQRRKNAQSGIG